MSCIDDTVDEVVLYTPVEFLVREAAQQWERDEAHALRRAVFCVEQGLFVGDDRDAIDDNAQLLVAMSCIGGMPDQIVGTVRIHEASPGLWWGSRLAVHAAFRNQGHLGATLIRLAVTRARAQGCETFMAQVQAQNEGLFHKLRWRTTGELAIHGRRHVEMQPDFDFYPPCHDPVSGFVSRARPSPQPSPGGKGSNSLPRFIGARVSFPSPSGRGQGEGDCHE